MTGLQQRIERAAPDLTQSTAKDLRRAIWATLKKASDHGRLKTPDHEIRKEVDFVAPAEELKAATKREARAIAGGVKDFRRDPASAKLVRNDGAWFHFTLTVGEENGVSLELVAYDFELVFPLTHSPAFVRFDLNQRGHRNEARELRSHLHPGHDGLLLPAPILDPLEAIGLMLELKPR